MDTLVFAIDDSVCTGDSVTLTTGGGTFYQWYNDTNIINGAVDSNYVTYQSGDFWATVTSVQGCVASTNVQPIIVVPYPGILTFFNNNNALTTFSQEPNLQWHMNGAPVPGETNTIFNITQDGYYFLTATNALGCYTSSDTLFIPFTPIGIGEEQAVLSSLKIYPNPSSGSFVIKFAVFQPENISISVIDLVGRSVCYNKYGSVNGVFESAVDLGDVLSGVYTININIGDYSFHRKLLVK